MKKDKMTGIVISFVMALTVFSIPVGAFAAAPDVDYHTQDEIRDVVNESGATANDRVTFTVEPVKKSPYDIGKVSKKSLNSALAMLNNIRFVAGLDPVALDVDLTESAQGAAFLCYVNNKLAHTGQAKPSGMTDEMYDLCANGASSSNLSAGYGTLNTAILGWMEDSDSSNIDCLGHRRWLLNPAMGLTGFGYAGLYGTMKVFDYSGAGAQNCVAWPAQNTPIEYINYAYSEGTYAWSLSTGATESKASVNVKLKRKQDGKVWTFGKSSANGYFNINNDYYGETGCIIFCPDDIAYDVGDRFHVTITGTSKGTIDYDVSLFALVPIRISDAAKFSLSKKSYAYTGKAVKPSVKVRENGSRKLIKGTDYTVSYKNNKKIGTATVTIKGEGNGNYTGSKKIKFKIVPTAPTLKSVKGAKKAITVKWSGKASQSSGYEIRCATNKSFSKNKTTVRVKGGKSVSKKVKKLKRNKNYYVKVRAYKTVNGKKYYSAWSKVKKVRTK